MVSGGVNETLKVIFASCSFLFSFETKVLYLRLVSFISVDVQRSLLFLRQHMKKTGKKQLLQTRNDERKEKQLERQKIKVIREQSLVDQALVFVKDIRKRSVLEVNYQGEEGTGLGPTLEFYSLLGFELQSDKTMWRKGTVDGTLYPRSLQIIPENQAEIQKICDKFHLAGVFVAKSVLDDRQIDMPIGELMWDLVFERKKNLYDLKKLDANMFALFSELQLMANKKQEIDQSDIDPELKQRLLTTVKSSKEASIEEYDLSFYNPSDETVELVKDGLNIKVTLDNLQNYIDLVIDSTFNESIRMQISAFKKGFNQILGIENLKIFQSFSELETLVCGEAMESQNSSEWTDLNKLSELINTAHGYNPKSKGFLFFLRYVSEMPPKERPMFIQFLTGSPRLPIGGFGALEPRLTVVLKKPETQVKYTSDQILPSVMTCQNYLKLPEYSTYDILKAKFDTAVSEGCKHFGMA